MLPVKNAFMYLAIMCQPVEDGSYKASNIIIISIIQHIYNLYEKSEGDR